MWKGGQTKNGVQFSVPRPKNSGRPKNFGHNSYGSYGPVRKGGLFFGGASPFSPSPTGEWEIKTEKEQGVLRQKGLLFMIFRRAAAEGFSCGAIPILLQDILTLSLLAVELGIH